MIASMALAVLLAADPARSEGVLPDVALVTQDGARVTLASLVEGKVAVVNAFFTSCRSTCPRVMRRLSSVQRKLGDRVGRDVVIVSLSVDPERDTPERLASYARRFGAGRGWRLLTGPTEDVDEALRRLGWLTAKPEAHSALVLVVDVEAGTWRRAEGLGDADRIVEVVEELLEARE